jgi:hypothetical protein
MGMTRKSATLLLLTLLCAPLYTVPAAASTAAKNLLIGVTGQVNSDLQPPPYSSALPNWAGNSALVLMPGAALLPVTSAKTTLYLGFTAGSTADIGGMVIYTTARGGTAITAVTPVKLGGVSNPSINLASTSVCPVAPSPANPCIVRLDPTALALSPLFDYYFVVYFTNDTNNKAIGGADPDNTRTSLSGLSIAGDGTQLKVGGSVPVNESNPTTHYMDFLMYVMSN